MGATPRAGAGERPEEGGGPPPVVVVLVAFEPRSYREAIGGAIQALRPRLQVRVAEPGEPLGAEVARLGPRGLVLCGQPDPFTTSGGGPSWVEFRPYEGPKATVCVDGRRSELEKVELDDLLSIVDRVQALAGSLPTPAAAPGRRR